MMMIHLTTLHLHLFCVEEDNDDFLAGEDMIECLKQAIFHVIDKDYHKFSSEIQPYDKW